MGFNETIQEYYRNKKPFLDECKEIVKDYYNHNKAISDQQKISVDDIYVTQYFEIDNNGAAFLTVKYDDTTYYKVSYNGEMDETILNVYAQYDRVDVSS